MATQAERRAATGSAIRTAARRLFADRGFGATSMDDIATEAGVTKGALYHHFASKERLFEAIFRAVEDDLYEDVVAALPADGSGVDVLVGGARTFMRCCLAPDVHQIVLVDGPTVLGWKLWREIDAERFLPLITAGLAADAAPGRDVTPIAHLLIGAADEAVMLLAAAEDPSAAIDEITDGMEVILRAVAAAVAQG